MLCFLGKGANQRKSARSCVWARFVPLHLPPIKRALSCVLQCSSNLDGSNFYDGLRIGVTGKVPIGSKCSWQREGEIHLPRYPCLLGGGSFIERKGTKGLLMVVSNGGSSFFQRSNAPTLLTSISPFRSRPSKPNQRKGQNEKFMNFAHFCEFWCFSLGKTSTIHIVRLFRNAPVKSS